MCTGGPTMSSNSSPSNQNESLGGSGGVQAMNYQKLQREVTQDGGSYLHQRGRRQATAQRQLMWPHFQYIAAV